MLPPLSRKAETEFEKGEADNRKRSTCSTERHKDTWIDEVCAKSSSRKMGKFRIWA